jgi:hypothetical protein
MSVSATILEQMGGHRRLVMMVGAKNFLGSKTHLSFRFGGSHRHNYVKIVLNGSDLYDVTIGRTNGVKPLKNVTKGEGLFADQLVTFFEETTGMYLSF